MGTTEEGFGLTLDKTRSRGAGRVDLIKELRKTGRFFFGDFGRIGCLRGGRAYEGVRVVIRSKVKWVY